MGPVSVEHAHRAYGVLAHDFYDQIGDLDASHVLVQVTDDLSATECDELMDHLDRTYGSPWARNEGYGITWSYRLIRRPTLRKRRGGCGIWVGLERPRVDPLNRRSDWVKLPDEVQYTWYVTWQRVMRLALTGTPRDEVDAACAAAGLDPASTQLLMDQLDAVY